MPRRARVEVRCGNCCRRILDLGTDPAVVGWLADWSQALAANDVGAAAALFNADSYWRDLVSFTWNIVTVEGRGAWPMSTPA